jgi:hypothetical protein
MDIKRLIKEELRKDLLTENVISDISSKFNISQIKKLLKEKLDIDETSTKLDVAKKILKYYYNLNLKMLKYELGAILGYFIFYILSVFLDVAGVEPFSTKGEPGIPHFILWAAGVILGVYKVHKNSR